MDLPPLQPCSYTFTIFKYHIGPIYSLKFFRTPVLVLNSASVARDLLELRSSKYANRPLPKIVEM